MRKNSLKGSGNRTQIYKISVFTVIAGLLLVALLFFIGNIHIRVAAEEELSRQQKAIETNSLVEFTSPEMFSVSLDASELQDCTQGEKRLIRWYQKNNGRISNGRISRFSDRRYCYYFYPVSSASGGKTADLVYMDMSYPRNMVRMVSLVLLGAVAVFSNLLSNAMRYAEQEICLKMEKDKNQIRVAVANDEKDISGEELSHAFERFYKGTKGQTGIGMALAKEYVRIHQGTIRADAECGRVVFTVDLPPVHQL